MSSIKWSIPSFPLIQSVFAVNSAYSIIWTRLLSISHQEHPIFLNIVKSTGPVCFLIILVEFCCSTLSLINHLFRLEFLWFCGRAAKLRDSDLLVWALQFYFCVIFSSWWEYSRILEFKGDIALMIRLLHDSTKELILNVGYWHPET